MNLVVVFFLNDFWVSNCFIMKLVNFVLCDLFVYCYLFLLFKKLKGETERQREISMGTPWRDNNNNNDVP